MRESARRVAQRIGAIGPLESITSAVILARSARPSLPFLAGQARKKGFRYYRLQGTGMKLELEHGTPDIATFDQAFVSRFFDPPIEARQAFDALPSSTVAVDLGANIGMWSLWLANQKANPRITAVEPLPRNAERLRRNARLNPGLRIEVVEAAAATSIGEARFDARSATTGRLAAESDSSPHMVTVRSIDVFDLILDADLLKIDIEGGEWLILADARLEKLRASVVFLEFHPHGCPTGDPLGAATEALARAGLTRAVGHVFEGRDDGSIWAWRPRGDDQASVSG